jgi:hypothetical protein
METQKILWGTVLGVIVASNGCLDLNLRDELREPDAGAVDETGAYSPVETADISEDADEVNDAETPSAPGTDPEQETIPVQDANDQDPPVLLPPACAETEQLVEAFCLAQGALSMSIRFTTDEGAEVTLGAETGLTMAILSDPWEKEHHAAVSGLTPGISTPLTIAVTDINANGNAMEVLLTAAGGHPIAITEVLADPLGPEPAQEFVEIANLGPADIDLSGWMIDDNGDQDGDVIPDGTVIGGGTVGIIVSAAYIAGAGGDPSPAPGTLIIPLESSIGTGGLKNSAAETVELYDADGVLVSRYLGQTGTPREGCGAVRVSAELPDGDAHAFENEPTGSSTPGLAPQLDSFQ